MRRLTWYNVLGAATLALAAMAATLAAAAAVLRETLSISAASLCSAVFLVPGLYFLGYARHLRAREVALTHAAAFAETRRVLEVPDLAAELKISNADAEKILRTAVREGHLRGRFDPEGRFVSTREGDPGESP